MSIKTVSAIEAIHELQQGKMIILVDDPERENEGDLIFPAESINPAVIQFMIQHGSGIICLPMMAEQLKKLNLPLMVPAEENTSQRGTPFTVSIEAKEGVSTGVSAADRAQTILAAMRADAKPEDLVRPGHVFPLKARDGGVFERAGHTEGSIDIVRAAGFQPAAVLCEVMNPDGTMARGENLQAFADTHGLKILTIQDLIDYRLCYDNLIEEEISSKVPLEGYGVFNLSVIKEKWNSKEHIVLTHEKTNRDQPPLVRVHSACMTGDLFGSQRCDCKQQLHYSLQQISEQGGILIYLNQEGRGIGLLNKIKAYALQEKGADTVEANQKLGWPVDARQYYMAAQILRGRHIRQIRLLTNNPHKFESLQKYGLAVERVPLPIFFSPHNQRYLQTKQSKMNHLIDIEMLMECVHDAH